MTHPADASPRDIPPDVLTAADITAMNVQRLLGGLPLDLVSMAYRRGRDDGAGGPADMSEAALRVTAKAVSKVRPGVAANTALAVIESLLVLGWRPPPAGPAADHATLAETKETH